MKKNFFLNALKKKITKKQSKSFTFKLFITTIEFVLERSPD